MRLVSFAGGFGRVEGEWVIPMGGDIMSYLTAGVTNEHESPILLESLGLVSPVPFPGKIICIGLNYRDHAFETGQPIPDEPVLFAKYANSLVGPGRDIVVPQAASAAIDYEAELGVVIGRPASRVAPAEAMEYVAGYMCLNDVSDRDLQMRGGQWTRGKAIDTFMPAGPWLTTVDELPNPQSLWIRCVVNGEIRQQSNTSEMIFGVGDLVSFLSRTITLAPGDLIATGTPAGVGMATTPPRYLTFGDEVVVEIEGLGALHSRLRGEGSPVDERTSASFVA
jgi:2-keto-4-pentenoate hydratase/2-oxohepta-3-ene-1,7-dioic acid hydratase in catechol pathway